MKKNLRIITIVLLVLIMMMNVTACKGAPDSAAGTYAFVWEKGPVYNREGLDYTYTLDGYGKGEYFHKNATHKIKYTLTGDNIEIKDTITGIRYNGTCKAGELHIYDGNPQSDMVSEFMFQKK